MFDKKQGLFDAFVKQQMSRRELIQATGKLGLGAAATGMLLNQAQTRAMAADFDWMKYKGSKLKLLLNKHPYADAMIANIDTFKTMTGMDVSYDIFAEDVYFDKVTAAMSSALVFDSTACRVPTNPACATRGDPRLRTATQVTSTVRRLNISAPPGSLTCRD